MDPTRTRAELVVMALEDLLVVGSGQSPEDEDVEKVDSRVDGLFDDLATREVVYIPNEDEIPAAFCETLSELLANACAPVFGKVKMTQQQREAVESRLKAIVATRPTYEVLKVDYF